MISFPSSFQSSRVSNKENVNPNANQIKPSGFSPFSDEKSAKPNLIKPQDFPSAISAVQDNKKQRLRTHSMKTLMKGFCNTIDQTHENYNMETFSSLVSRAAASKKELNRKQVIEFCEQNSIQNKEDLFATYESRERYSSYCGNKQLRRWLGTDLGQLKIQQLCECLQKGENISKEQEQMIQILIPYDIEAQINSSIIMQQYQQLKQQIKAENQDKKKLSSQFKNIYRSKIQPKLWSDHFRLELSKALNLRSEKQKISYNSLCKSLQTVLTHKESSIVFRHIYALQTGTLMPILDNSKRISKQILLANITQQGENQIREVSLEQKNVNYVLEENYKTIQKLKQQKMKHLQIMSNKDKQIERLNRYIDFLKIQNECAQKLNKTKIEAQIQAYKNKYESKIQQLMTQNKQQIKLTQWYQRQLQAIIREVNKEAVIQKFLHPNFNQQI